ncbi:MAG: ferritin family protein [Planctomycetota bacterium]
MLPTNLSPLEVIDAGIHSETLAFKMYDRLARRVEVPTLLSRLTQLKKDEKDHRKTLRAHRRSMFSDAPMSMTESDAAEIFGKVDVDAVVDKDSLIQALFACIKYEEYGAYFYDRQRHKLPNREARIFFEVLASEGEFHGDILRRQIEALRPLHLALDDRGRTVEVAY